MLGAIAGDIIGSVYEHRPIKTTDFPLFQSKSRFTDDTVLTVAVADAIIKKNDYQSALKTYGRAYPDAGFGMLFFNWLFSADSQPYNSFGNGSAMRVSPVGFAFDTREEVLAEAEKCAAMTHNHPQGIAGAQAVALAVWMAWQDASKNEIKQEIETRFGYDLNRRLDDIRPGYSFDVTCQGSVPEALIAFYESEDLEDAIRKAISLGGDSDTLGCITGGIAQAYYKKIPEDIISKVYARLPEPFVPVIEDFNRRFHIQL
ncbi:MAG TPA: ADP-ribosylglycohydrolase family protein [Desulfosalsimonadaceae bacterium]|nr:ADP-ribosylglycohydrolase family protein [Desulfosalsimonadaceae bacterium]